MTPIRHSVCALIFLLVSAMPALAQDKADQSGLICCGFVSAFLLVGVLIVGTAILRNSPPAKGSASMHVRELVGQRMSWRLTPGSSIEASTFELCAGSDVVAILQQGGSWTRRPFDETWSFAWTGTFDKQVEVRVDGTVIAVYADGTLTMADGVRYHWKCTSFWRSQMGFCNEADEPLLTYASGHTTVTIQPAGASVFQIALLTVLGVYILYKGMRLGDTGSDGI